MTPADNLIDDGYNGAQSAHGVQARESGAGVMAHPGEPVYDSISALILGRFGEVEAVAVRVATAFDEGFGAEVNGRVASSACSKGSGCPLGRASICFLSTPPANAAVSR